MRIISGKFKSLKLFIPINKDTRPLKDITKESIFNMLIHFKKFPFELKNTKILDIYSGTGSFGLECLSRNANKVTFVENNKNALKILKKNIFKLGVQNQALIIDKSALGYLSSIKKSSFKVDLIFLDPPFKDQNTFELIENIISSCILEKNGIIIIHRSKKTEDIYPDKFKILDIRNYGISKILFGNLTS